jgi:hypothetical protein
VPIAKDDLDATLEEWAQDDPAIFAKVQAALGRREMVRELVALRKRQKLTQVALAALMGTSQGQVARVESGADTRVSTIERYAAAVGYTVAWRLEPAKPAKARPKAPAPRPRVKAGSR